MFGNTGKQLKTAGKEVLSIFKAIRDDIRQERQLHKEFKAFKEAQLQKESATSETATHAHEDTKN